MSFGTRGAADELARLLDDGLSGGSVPAVALAARLRGIGADLDNAVAPRAEFRDALRMRLVAVATVQAAAPVAVPAARPVAAARAPRVLDAAVSWSAARRRGSAIAAGALASVVAVSGVAVAGSQSLPGDPFYGVKRTTEAFQLRTADGAFEKGTRHLDFAATRLREVRGLTLGRDAADAGPALGPSAMSGGITLRSAVQPLARGDALSAPVASRVKQTLAEMDEQTRAGSALLTRAYRSSRTAEPLRALSRFATRQSAGLEQLLPALPPVTQDRARISLALLSGVTEETRELLIIGTCGAGCDPSQAAPMLPGATEVPDGSSTSAPCECAAPAPAPAPQVTAPPTEAAEPEDSSAPQPTTEPEPTQEPSSPSPSPSPSPSMGEMPLPLPTLLPLPPLPVPVPTITLAPGGVLSLPGSSEQSSTADSGPLPQDASVALPVPQLAPAPPRP